MRVRRNALRHGLAAVVLRDPVVTAEVERLAFAICGAQADPLEQEQALAVAEVQVVLKEIRKTRARIVEQLLHLPKVKPRQASDALPAWLTGPNVPSLDRLTGRERYERRAFARRKRALRLVTTGWDVPSRWRGARCKLT